MPEEKSASNASYVFFEKVVFSIINLDLIIFNASSVLLLKNEQYLISTGDS